MRTLVISLSLILLAIGIDGLPNKLASDENEENGLVYVFNVYAVRNAKSKTIGKILNDGVFGEVPPSFEPIGSIIVADEDAEEPLTLSEFSEFFEDMGVTVEKFSDDEDLKVIEIKMDMSLEDFDDVFDFDELEKLLEAEGIDIEIEVDNKGSTKTIKIAFNELRKDPKDQPFTMRELGEFFQREGYRVDVMTSSDGTIKWIRIHVDKQEEETTKHPEERTTTQRVEKKVEKKIEKHDERGWNRKDDRNDDRFSTLDFVTKSDSFNKIRKRRSTCPECRTGNLVKDFVEIHHEII